MGPVNFRRILLIIAIFLPFVWLALFWFLRSPSLTAAEDTTRTLPVDAKGIEAIVRALAAIEPNRSYENDASMFKAEELLVTRFKALGYDVRLQEIHVAGAKNFHNVIARYGSPDAKDLIVVGAHYDVAGTENPGANDNASGVAGLLELARLLQTMKPAVSNPIELVAYTLEEPPFFSSPQMGSVVHADSLKQAGLNVRLMLSLETIGSYSDEPGSQRYPIPLLYGFYPSRANFVALIGRPQNRGLNKDVARLMSANSSVPIQLMNAPGFIQGVDFSDHRSYWAHGWPALMVTDTAFLRSDDYHQETDTPEKLDFAKIAQVIRGVYAAVVAQAR